MRLVDTHCHLDFPDFKEDLTDVLKRCEEAGVVRVISPGTNVASTERSAELAGKYPAVFAAAGIHPHDADKTGDDDISRLRDIAIGKDKIIAIGEIGLDYYRKYSSPENQKKLFRGCLSVAKELGLPVILHNRAAGKDFLSILKEAEFSGIRGVVHCFSGDNKFLEEILELGMFVSFAGNITFDKAGDIRDLVKSVPVERLMLETDSPYISPEPARGKRNEPGNVRHLLEVYSGLYNLTAEDIARITTHNANYLFRLGIEEKSKAAYAIRNSLYLNITNRCTNGCTFCTRYISNFVKGHNLKLEKEPSVEEIIAAMGDISGYDEVTFCGFGEPTLRLGAVKKIASYVKEKGVKVRMVTNGEGSLIARRPIISELAGLIDDVSVSLNAPDAAAYDRLCRSVFGENAYDAILEFIQGCRKEGIGVEVTCLDLAGEGVS
ncbi:MAG: TatD family hydrolase, partial [Candidatus Omnitrophota bacterium]